MSNVEKNNRMIAEFMNIPPCDRCKVCGQYKFGPSNMWHPKDMKYPTSWDWLMPVVEKIEVMGYDIEIRGKSVFIHNLQVGCPGATKLEATYAAVTSFINNL